MMRRLTFYSMILSVVLLSCREVETKVTVEPDTEVVTQVEAQVETEVKTESCDGTQTFSKINITAENLITWTVDNDCAEAVYELKEFRWNKWMTLGEINSKGLGSNEYTFSVDNNCDLYTIRIELKGSRRCRSPKVESANPKFITFNPHGKTQLLFSGSTRYEVYTESGVRILNGCADKVDVTDLKGGAYYLNYGNETTKLTR